MIAEIIAGLVQGLFGIGRAIERDIKAGRVEDAKRKAREESDRIIGRAAARYARQKRIDAKKKASK